MSRKQYPSLSPPAASLADPCPDNLSGDRSQSTTFGLARLTRILYLSRLYVTMFGAGFVCLFVLGGVFRTLTFNDL